VGIVPFLDLGREVDYLGAELFAAAERVIRSGSYVPAKRSTCLSTSSPASRVGRAASRWETGFTPLELALRVGASCSSRTVVSNLRP
jgi:hypothetical protein